MGKDKSPDHDRAVWIRNLGLFSLIVSDLLISTLVGVGLGYWAWKKLGAPWWILLLASLAGLSVAFYRLYLFSKRDWK